MLSRLLEFRVHLLVQSVEFTLLPPAYVVQREGNVLTRVCPSINLSVHRGGGSVSQLSQGGVSVQPGRGEISPAGGGSVQPGGGQSSR